MHIASFIEMIPCAFAPGFKNFFLLSLVGKVSNTRYFSIQNSANKMKKGGVLFLPFDNLRAIAFLSC
jgi:hypothetical protein